MELDLGKEVCATCDRWGGKRDQDGSDQVIVSPSARGMCAKRNKPKPPHGGCDDWQAWEKDNGT